MITILKRTALLPFATVALGGLSFSSQAEETTYSFGGFIKFDAMYSMYSDTTRSPAGVGNEFFVPSLIAVNPAFDGDSGYFDASANLSRINFKTNTKTEAGELMTYVEQDFRNDADERLVNRSNASMRHAFLKWTMNSGSSITAGSTWSTFFNVGALPESVDFIGPTSGTVFVRQPQIRYTTGGFMVAAENPSVSFYDGGAGFNSNQVDQSTMPDIVARYNGKAGDLSYAAAAVVRQIAYDIGTADGSETGTALSFSGKYGFSNGNDFKFMFNYGNLGRYIALQAYRDAAILANGDIELVSNTSGYVAYKHNWSDKARTTVTYAFSSAENPEEAGLGVTESANNVNVNFMYSPAPKLTFGVEYLQGARTIESGDEGTLQRYMFTTKLAF